MASVETKADAKYKAQQVKAKRQIKALQANKNRTPAQTRKLKELQIFRRSLPPSKKAQVKKNIETATDIGLTALTFVPGLAAFGLGAKAIQTGIKAGKIFYKVGKKTYKSKDAAEAAVKKLEASKEINPLTGLYSSKQRAKDTAALKGKTTKGITKTEATKEALETSAKRLAKGAGGATLIAAIANKEKKVPKVSVTSKPKAESKPNKPKTAPQPKAESKPQVTPKPKAAPAKVPKVTSKVVPKGTSKVAPKGTSKVAPSLDKLSFSKAFNESRDEHGGPGGVFTWRGKKYQTNIKGEAYVKNPKSVWKTKPSVKGGRRFEREKPGERAEAKSLQTEVDKAWETIKNMKTGGKVTNPARIKSTIRMTNGGGVGSKLIDDIYKEKAGFFSEEMPKGKVSQMKKRVVPKPNVKQGVKPYALTDSLRQERALQKILKKKGISMEEFEEQFKDKRTIGDHAKELIKSGKIKKQRFSYSKKGKTAAKRKRKK